MITSASRVVQYALAYPFDSTYVIDFKFWTTPQIHAVLSFDDGTADLPLVITTDYTLSAPGDTGTLTKVSDWDHEAVRLTIYRELDLEQETDYRNGEAVDLDLLEKDFDYAVARDQQIAETISRSFRAPITDEPADNELPGEVERASKFLAFDASGTPIAAVGIASVPVSPFMETLLDDTTVAEARETLGVGTVGNFDYIIAAFDADTDWKGAANYTMTSGTDDLTAAIEAAITGGAKSILLSPGNFKYSTTFDPNSADIAIALSGCGPTRTIITNNANLPFIQIGSSFTGKIHGSDFGIIITGALTATMAVIDGYNAAAGVFNQKWSGIKITMTAITGPSLTLSGFFNCANLTQCEIDCNSNTDADILYQLFNTCEKLDSCSIDYDGNTQSADYTSGFRYCEQLSNCKILVAGLSTTGRFMGYLQCNKLSSCVFKGDGSGAYGTGYGDAFYGCFYVSSSYAKGARRYGFASCYYTSACGAEDNEGGGFSSCYSVSASYSLSNTGPGFSSCEHVIGSQSWSNTTYGFVGCKQCQQNYATGNTTAQYNTSFADQATNACANTAAGGYNR
jgi:hypothetical protein